MACQHVNMPGGGAAIVCGARKRQRCACGRNATLLCDWIVPGGTCDEPLCRWCTTSPAPEKDLCPAHLRAYRAWQAQRAARSGGAPECAPLPDPDASADPAANVSAPRGRSSRHALAAEQPETATS